jgi:hypothetical protein
MRATTSNRDRFLDVESQGCSYFGTYYGSGNPIKALLDEAGALFRGQKIASVTSVGAGQGSVITLPYGSHSNASEIMFQMAQDCERDAEEVADRFYEEQENEPGYNPYVRLSVEQGMQTTGGLDNDAIEAHTNAYLKSWQTIQTIDAIVDRLTRSN